MYRTDDPLADFDRWDIEQARKEARLPICSECGERIHGETAYYIHDCWICEECMDNNYKVDVEDYVEL